MCDLTSSSAGQLIESVNVLRPNIVGISILISLSAVVAITASLPVYRCSAKRMRALAIWISAASWASFTTTFSHHVTVVLNA